MAYKFPWTNYHELNLDWILDTVKKLFAQTEQNNAVVEQYDGRLTEVELTADNAQTAAEQAQSDSAAALSLAQGAQTTATQAQQAAAQAQQAAGQAQTAAGQAQEAAATAQQTATQAQQTAQNFDGRITQAENNAASALQAAQAFDEQVQGAITAANNANTAATTALTTATETSRELAAQRETLQEAAQDAITEIETAGQAVIDSIPQDYTELSNGVSTLGLDFNMLTFGRASNSNNHLGLDIHNFHLKGTLTDRDNNICITGDGTTAPTQTAFSTLNEKYFSVYLVAGKKYTFVLLCDWESSSGDAPNGIHLADKETRTSHVVALPRGYANSGIFTINFTPTITDFYAIKVYFPSRVTIDLQLALYPPNNVYQRISSNTALTLSN